MKVWHHGELKTQAQVWTDQTPAEIYHDCDLRMSGSAAPGHAAALKLRWPTLGDCNRAMVAAYEAMSTDDRAYEDDKAQADLALISIGL